MPSMVWTCFQKTAAGPKCLLCNDLRKRRDSSTKTMWVHLKLKHLDIYQRLRNADTSTKAPLKSEGVNKTNETMNPQLLAQYNSLVMSNYMNSLYSNQPFAQAQNPLLFQTMAFNKFIFQLYAQLFTNNCYASANLTASPSVDEQSKESQETRYDLTAHWPETGLIQNCVACNCKTNITCKKCNVGVCVNCFQQFHIP